MLGLGTSGVPLSIMVGILGTFRLDGDWSVPGWCLFFFFFGFSWNRVVAYSKLKLKPTPVVDSVKPGMVIVWLICL